jgi:hypothetical protein
MCTRRKSSESCASWPSNLGDTRVRVVQISESSADLEVSDTAGLEPWLPRMGGTLLAEIKVLRCFRWNSVTLPNRRLPAG